ncbi:MAG: penicillin-insensitive murein endopeptidase [Myxococcota bacterium]
MRTWLLLTTMAAACGQTPPLASERGDASATEAQSSAAARAPATRSEPPGSNTPLSASSESTGSNPPLSAGSEPPSRPSTPDPLAAEPSSSTSRGSPTAGSLTGGLALPLRAPGLLFLPSKDPDSRYGTVELVQGLVRAAATVESADPGAPVTVGDLARPQGGEISGHASHRSGRDVDVLFYLQHEDGRPFVPSKFIPLDPQGHGTDYGDLADPADDVPVVLDIARTWQLVAALLGDEPMAIQKILIVEHLRTMLLEQARRVAAPEAIVRRFSEVTCQPRFPHDDHMHIRVFCSAQDIEAGCEDTRPIFPWRRKALAAEGVTPVLAGKKPKTPSKTPRTKKLKTIEQARAEAGPMHQDVIDFLDRRQTWARKPHPGRRWCR